MGYKKWADSYWAENSVPAADKVAYNKVGEFETQTVEGDTFVNQDIPGTTFLVFLDPEDAGAADFYAELVNAVEEVRSAGADIVVCSKGDMKADLFQDAPFAVVEYNDSMKTALVQNDEMASGVPCVGVWYVNGSLISAWISQVDAEELVDSAASFAQMSQDMGSGMEGSMSAVRMG